MITPDLFRTLPCPIYPEIRLALGAGGRIGELIDRGQARRHPYRDRRAARAGGAALVPQEQPPLHHRLSHAVSGISGGADGGATAPGLCPAAPLSCAVAGRDGGDRIGAARAGRARLRQSEALGARRRRQAVQSGAPLHRRLRHQAADLPDRRPGRGGEEPARLPRSRFAGLQGGGGRRGRSWPS